MGFCGKTSLTYLISMGCCWLSFKTTEVERSNYYFVPEDGSAAGMEFNILVSAYTFNQNSRTVMTTHSSSSGTDDGVADGRGRGAGWGVGSGGACCCARLWMSLWT